MKGMEYCHHPDLIGTTPGMLKKAVSILASMAQYEGCRKPFIKYTDKFIKITVSQFVDPQLVSQLASIIYMIQSENAENESIVVESFKIPDLQLMDLQN
uniref:Uncharacterized protein n=1 Tax=Panagrolaimus superbus TaxID=310955 RepID=A0A914Z0H4_9BILA